MSLLVCFVVGIEVGLAMRFFFPLLNSHYVADWFPLMLCGWPDCNNQIPVQDSVLALPSAFLLLHF